MGDKQLSAQIRGTRRGKSSVGQPSSQIDTSVPLVVGGQPPVYIGTGSSSVSAVGGLRGRGAALGNTSAPLPPAGVGLMGSGVVGGGFRPQLQGLISVRP